MQESNETLPVIATKTWVETLFKLYRILSHSKIDYGCYIYGAPRKPYLKSLNTVQHKGLRLVLGCLEHPQWKDFTLRLMNHL